MLKLITLYTIEQIFLKAEPTPSPREKMVYINCLTNYFRDKKPTRENAMGFNLYFKDNQKLIAFFQEFRGLAESKIVELRTDAIFFPDLWYEHMDTSKLIVLNAPQPQISPLSEIDWNELEEYLRKDEYGYQLAAMKLKITKEKYEMLITMFLSEQKHFKKKYHTITDAVKHFTFWQNGAISRMPSIPIKKTPKILGED